MDIKALGIADIHDVIKMYLSQSEHDKRLFHPCPFCLWLVAIIAIILSIESVGHRFIRLIFPRVSFIPLVVRDANGNQCVGFGYLQMRCKNSGGKYLATLGIMVCEDSRKRGIGSRLMMALIEKARGNDVGKIWLTVAVDNEPAIKLYHKHGFNITVKRYGVDKWRDEYRDVYEMECLIGDAH